MKVSLALSGPRGTKMWDFEMNYYDLPLEYAAEVATAARSFATYIKNLAGGASAADAKKYSVTFAYALDPALAKSLGPEVEKAGLVKGAGAARDLLYSQAVAVQDAGIALLTQLQAGAHMEIASGERT